MTMIRRIREKLRNEDGAVTLWVVITTPALVIFLLFGYDVSAHLQAEQHAYNTASAAARAGANAISGEVVINGTTAVDSVQAVNAARGYLTRAGLPGNVTVRGDMVIVTINTVYDTKFIPVNMPIHQTATSQLRTQ